jgi:hypothetical protein
MSPFLGVLATLTLLIAAPAARAATSPYYFGTNLQTLGAADPSKWPTFLDQLTAGKMDIDRIEVDWKNVEPNAPSGGSHTYQWGSTDSLIGLMAQKGLRAAPIFRFAPGWEATKNSDGSVKDEFPPAAFPDFAAFLVAFSHRYGPGGAFWTSYAQSNPTVAAQPVGSYEIWNEVNLNQYAWNHVADPAAYAALLKVVSPAIHAAQPGAVVLGDLAWQNGPADGTGVYPNYATALGAAGGLQYLDAMGYHPYAPDANSIFTLVRRLRTELDNAGYPGMPIYANEAGLPADFTGPGIQFAADIPSDPTTLQFPSDGARASSLEFAGEALADSDCGVDEFLPYSITGSETTNDPIHEGFMGILRKADGSATKTAIGLQRASLRWWAEAGPGGTGIPPRLVICGTGASPDASLLTIPITITGSGAGGCVDMTDTYDGNPMESAVLHLDSMDGTEVASAVSDAYGQAHACPPDPNMVFKAYADIPGAGISGTVLCDIPNQGCPGGVTFTPSGRSTVSAIAATGYQVPSATATPAPETHAQLLAKAKQEAAAECSWTLTVTLRERTLHPGTKKSRVTVRPLLKCPTVPTGTVVRFILAVRHRGAKRDAQSRSVFLKTGEAKNVDIVGSLASTDTISFTHAAEVVTDVPRIVTSVRISAPIAHK